MNRTSSLQRWIATAATAALLAPSAQADNWPAWRGPNHDAVSAEKNLPVEWSAEKNVLWKMPLPGPGAATPAVWGDRIFLTSEEGDDLVIICLGTDGKERWKAKLGSGAKKARGGEGNGATPSPSTDGKLVFAYVGTGDFAAFDFAGREAWRFNAQDRYTAARPKSPATTSTSTASSAVVGVKPEATGLLGSGALGEAWRIDKGTPDVPSPVVYEGRVYLCRENGVLTALDAATGTQIYSDRRGGGRE